MLIQTKFRTEAEEIMDDFELQGSELLEALDKIAAINQLLGGNTLTLQGVQKLLQNNTTDKFVIVDVGCGNGDMLRTLANFANQNKLNFELIGVDANSFTIDYAKKLSVNYPTISYLCEDIFGESFSELKYDIVLCTLTLHHFKNKQIDYLINLFSNQSRLGIVINDLHRSKIAYRLFQLVCFVFRLNTMSRNDGLISILRGFKKEELTEFSKKINALKQTIQWKWAFRYQWIIWK
jgi:2-polyprenyl-3-methyl-5-hydroxy-6-metoxy-1,4-benzoquinol methylase